MASNQISLVQEYIDDILKVEYMEDMFTGYISNEEENSEFKLEKYKSKFHEIIVKLNKNNEPVDKNILEYINLIGNTNGQKLKLFFDVLESAVNNNVLSSIVVSTCLLNSNKLKIKNQEFWCSSFDLIMKIIIKADYKEIRDLIRIMLDLITNIPSSIDISLIPQLESIYKVFEYLFNRDLALFPAYLVFDEIRKKKSAPHWRFGLLISSFIDSFKPVATMCSIAGSTKLYPVVGYRSVLSKVWQLDSNCKLVFKGLLPLSEEIEKPQIHFLKYALSQPYSKDFVTSLLQLKNQRYFLIEDVFLEMIISMMEKSESCSDFMNENSDSKQTNQLLLQWQCLANNVREFVMQIIFQEIVKRLTPILQEKNLKKGRDQLIWLFLQFVPMGLSKAPFVYFSPLIKLIDVLYTEQEPLPLPNLNKPSCVQNFAASSLWVIALMKAEIEQIKLTRNPPVVFKNHIDYIMSNKSLTQTENFDIDFKVSIIANTYFANNNTQNTNNELSNKIITSLLDTVTGVKSKAMKPLPVIFLDSLCVQMKIHLAQAIVNFITKQIQNNKANPIPILPTVLETFCRLVVNSEIENPYLKYFIHNNLLLSIQSHSWITVHNLLETWSYRMIHIKLNNQTQVLSILNSVSNSNNQLIQHQLKLSIEHTLIKIILKLNIGQILNISHLIQVPSNENKINLISRDSEEFNKILILAFARAIHITGAETLSSEWCSELLNNIMQNTPFSWSFSTIQSFPKYISEFYQKQNNCQINRQISHFVDEDYRKLSMNENDLLMHFTQPSTPTVFICLMFKSLLETNQINQVLFKVLEKFSFKQFTIHLRSFCDYLVFELAKSSGQQLSKYIDTLNDFIWKYYVVSLDKLFLCLSLRPFEEEIEFNICLLIIQHVLLKKNEFRNRMIDFIKDFQPDHWLQDNLQEKYSNYSSKYPEKFYFEIQQTETQSYPYYFSNVCLRFLPVLDLIIHRYLEQFKDNMTNTNIFNNTNAIMETILDQMSPLYKFHEQPITFLYNTLHYYEPKLRSKSSTKKKLVSSVLNSFKDIRPSDWALSDQYLNYINSASYDWNPDLEYYIKLVKRLVDTIDGKQVYPNFDWKFNEFTNVGCHALHIICVELMALPKPGSVIANNLIDIVMIGHKALPRSSIMSWINAIGMILTALPEEYRAVLNNRLIQMLQSPLLLEIKDEDIFKVIDFTSAHASFSELPLTYLIAITHSFYLHAFIGQVSSFPEFLNEKVKPIIKTEEQFIFICSIVAPFLNRLVNERTRIVCDVTILLYKMLEIVDKNIEEFKYMDSICDLLYYIKYSFTGDFVKDDIETSILNLRPELQIRLRFMVHIPVNNMNILKNNLQNDSSNFKRLKTN